MTFPNTIVCFTLVNRKTGVQAPCWIASVSYADGPGMKVNKMTTTRDLSKAARFSAEAAHAVAVQFSQYPAQVQRPDGTALVVESGKLQAEQRENHATAMKVQAEINNEFNKALLEIAPLLRRAML